MTHKIIVRSEVCGVNNPTLTAQLKKTVRTAIETEGVTIPCEVDILLTNDAGIHAVNREMRNVDRPTDVLSFPMFDLQPGEHPSEEDADPDTNLVPLGDMCISVERAQAQGEEYGHGFTREICYLAVHSTLHLLGYDHMDEGEMKAQMRQHEEVIMAKLGLER